MTKVMLVDDDRTMVRLLRTLLELDGFVICQASRGMDVLPVARQEKPDLILMDVHLADADGLEILRELRGSDLASIPVLMSSGMDLEDECLHSGASAFILKPYPPDELVRAIRNLIR